jgi:hypothetical protein
LGISALLSPSLLQVIADAGRDRYIWPFPKSVEFKSVPMVHIDEVVDVAGQLGGFNF